MHRHSVSRGEPRVIEIVKPFAFRMVLGFGKVV